MIYIGREDCKECKAFESRFENLLEQFCVEIPVYYTTEDREGDRREEMYQILGNYNIDSVPCVILTKQSKMIKKWENPIHELKEIEKFL